MSEADLRKAFQFEYKELDFEMREDPWGRPMYARSHVDSLWNGFQKGYQFANRASTR